MKLGAFAMPSHPPERSILDGFRWDYLQRYSAPALQRLAREGVHARTMTPSYPTKTFPNHYTLVTGLRPARHGIVGNWFYDPANGETFGMSKPASNTDAKWWGGEPVWITAESKRRPECPLDGIVTTRATNGMVS